MKKIVSTLLLLAMLGAPAHADSVTGQAASLSLFLQGLQLRCHREFVADPAIAMMAIDVTLPMNDCGRTIELLKRLYGLRIEQYRGTYLVSSLTSGRVSETIQLKNASAATVATSINGSAAGGQGLIVIPDIRQNAVVLAGPPALVRTGEDLLSKLDKPSSVEQDAEFDVLNGDVTDEYNSLARLYNAAYGALSAAPDTSRSVVDLSGPPSAITEAKKLLTNLDQPVPEIQLYFTVTDLVPQNDQQNLGSTLNGVAPGAATSGSITVTPNQLFAPIGAPLMTTLNSLSFTLNTLMSKGEASILANPSMLTRSGKPVTIHIGQTVPIVTNNGGLVGGFTVTTEQTGVTITATATASANKRIHLNLDLGYSAVASVNAQGYPTFNDRKETVFNDVQSGQTLVLGGLKERDHSKTVTKVPILGDIPLFGRLFRNVQSSDTEETVVFSITPIIYDETKQAKQKEATQ